MRPIQVLRDLKWLMQEYYKTWHRAPWPNSTVYNFNNTKSMLVDADVVLLRSMDAILRCRHQLDLSATIGCIVRILNFRLANWSCRTMWSYCEGVEEKDGFLVSGSPILLPTGADIFRQFKDSVEGLQKKHERLPNGNCALVRRDHDN
jgi:hypothetical protein